VEVPIEDIDPERTVFLGLAGLSRKTGLIIRAVGPGTIERLFDEIEKYDSLERAETFEYLRRALHETRSSLSSEDVYGTSKLIDFVRR
jgi:hypothetical protein